MRTTTFGQIDQTTSHSIGTAPIEYYLIENPTEKRL